MEEIESINDNAVSVQTELLKMGHLGRVFQQCNNAFNGKRRNARAGNDIVRRWDAELIDHNSRQSVQSSSEAVNGPEKINTGKPDQ